MDVELVSAEAAPLQGGGASPTHPWRKEPLGQALEEVRGRLLSVGRHLQKHVDEHAAPLLQEAQKQLREATCRIGIIGQVKAGKSTFINALAERPGLLPSDINPSTVVVTLLNFRNSAKAPEHAGKFHFFSSEEWKDLAEGGGDLRKLTARLVPGFKPELLRAHLDFMRKRAERRLGSHFHDLLGKSHCFEELTPEVLADYISAGDYDELGASNRRHFSDITRTAELFFSEGPFAFPVTLIDTPGNNDPFLVRDEITRRALDDPDVFVFVLSALQPLSTADIAMLRLLNGLHKDRIVVFINRADQLPDPAADGAAVRSAVERRLRLEFPALDIPVVIGSSWWGSLGLLGEHIDLVAHLQPSHAAALLGAEAPAREADAHVANLDPRRLSHALYANSGLPQVATAITQSMASSGTAVLLRQIAACFFEIAKSTDVSAKAEFQSLEKLLAARRAEAAILGAKIAEEEESLRQFEERAGALRETFRHIEKHFTELIATGTDSLRSDLGRLVQEFSSQQAELVLQPQAPRGSKKTAARNLAPLRERLETAYLVSFGQIAGDLSRIESFLYPQLKVIVANLVSDCPSSYLEPPTVPIEPLPSAPLSAALAMDLGERWWKPRLATKPSPQQQANQLRSSIEVEFAAVVEELGRLAQIRLTERADYTLQRLKTIGDGLLTGIERRRTALAAQQRTLYDDGDHSLQRVDSELSQRLRSRADACAACTSASEELERVIEILDAGPGEARPPPGITEPPGP